MGTHRAGLDTFSLLSVAVKAQVSSAIDCSLNECWEFSVFYS